MSSCLWQVGLFVVNSYQGNRLFRPNKHLLFSLFFSCIWPVLPLLFTGPSSTFTLYTCSWRQFEPQPFWSSGVMPGACTWNLGYSESCSTGGPGVNGCHCLTSCYSSAYRQEKKWRQDKERLCRTVCVSVYVWIW